MNENVEEKVGFEGEGEGESRVWRGSEGESVV